MYSNSVALPMYGSCIAYEWMSWLFFPDAAFAENEIIRYEEQCRRRNQKSIGPCFLLSLINHTLNPPRILSSR